MESHSKDVLDTFENIEESNGIDIVLCLESQKLLLHEIISASIQIKADIVSSDERESGLRGLLNFGHTIGRIL